MAWHGMGSDGMGWRVYVFGVHDIMLPCYCMVQVCHFGLRVGGVYTSDFFIAVVNLTDQIQRVLDTRVYHHT